MRFISFEPLLEDLGELDLAGIHWAIVGGESGSGYRPLDHAWARAIRDQGVAQGVAYFFKQDAAPRAEMHPYLVEADGSPWKWEQFPDAMVPPWPYGEEQPPAPDEGWGKAPMLARETAPQPAHTPVYRRATDGQMRPALF